VEEHSLANPQEKQRLEADDARKAAYEKEKTKIQEPDNEVKPSNNNNLKK
jgi:hypothetical protein